MKGKQSLGAYEQRMLGSMLQAGRLAVILTLLASVVVAYAGNLVLASLKDVVIEIAATRQAITEAVQSLDAEVRSFHSQVQEALHNIGNDVDKIKDKTDSVEIKLAAIKDLSATMQASLAVVEATIVPMKQQFTNLLTRLTPIEQQLEAITEASTGTAENVGKVVLSLETLQPDVKETVTLLTEILNKMPIGSLIERMNREVNGIEIVNLDFVQVDLDVCEYDPLGIGPINCEGLESEGGTMQGVKFTFA